VTVAEGKTWKDSVIGAKEDPDHAEGAALKWKYAEAVSEYDCVYNASLNFIQACDLWVHYLRPFSQGNAFDLSLDATKTSEGPFSMFGYYYWDTDTNEAAATASSLLLENAPLFS